ncbi:hypothetical protein FNL55_13140 [Tardiphaga sp. vice352]|uniref:hypothetical protein n=1 Tax=Tardiphaga sp. vice352 TaxID=2592816 RepID=UPI0011652CB0|nr:hypothetical protein [Tardiphaga sp. vice352]QDM32176.1 hypothetical protein FNL55_13140 [Tardiphaga sp. vice352]
MIIVNSVVDPNPVWGGPPIVAGVASRTKTIPGGSLTETWPQPWPKEADLPAELLVSRRTRYGVGEVFIPPIAESKLPDEAQPDAVEKHDRAARR